MVDNLLKAHMVVTGGAGFMGSSFIHHFLQKKTFCGKMTNLDALTYAADPRHLDPFQSDPRYELVVGEIGDHVLLDQIEKKQKIDVIVHFAGQTHVDRSIANANAFFDTNVVGTQRLLEWVKLHPTIHFHHVSTDEVYGSLKRGRFAVGSAYRPSSPYAASKAGSDHLVLAYAHTFGLSCTLSQSCNNYGPRQFPEKFVPLMILQCLEEKQLPVYGNGSHRREWLFVKDHSDAIATILQSGRPGSVYPITSSVECSNITLLEWIIDAVAKETRESVQKYESLITFVPDRPGHDFRYALDPDPMGALGWKPRISIQEGLSRAVTWYSAHRGRVVTAKNGEHSWNREWSKNLIGADCL